MHYLRKYKIEDDIYVTPCPTYPHVMIGSRDCKRCRYFYNSCKKEQFIDCKSFDVHRNSQWNKPSCLDCVHRYGRYSCGFEGGYWPLEDDDDICDKFKQREKTK